MISTGVVIVTYNRLDLLKECIDCVLKQNVPFNKIYIINNNSTDGTKEYLDTISNDKINITNLKQNIGGAGGFSIGVEKAYSELIDWILLIDDDAMLNTNFNMYINNAINAYPDILAFSGTVITNSKIDFNHRRHLVKPGRFIETHSSPQDYAKDYFDCDFASFCGLMISRKIIKNIGFPNKEFFIWYDDTEYSLRIGKYSKIRNINTATLNHKTLVTSKKEQISWKNYYGRRNQLYIIRKYFQKKDEHKFLLLSFISILKNKLLYIISRKKKYKYKYTLYIDSIYDAKHGKLGSNKKYLPK